MLNWLKRRAKVSFNNRYTNLLRRSNSPEMFLTEQSMLSQQQTNSESIKLLIFSGEGEEYTLDVPLEMTLDRVKLMAIGHFYTPLEAVGGSSGMDLEGDAAKTSDPSSRYRLVLARDFRTLPEERSVASEELMDNDEILLTECRKPNFDPPLIGHSRYVNFNLEDSLPTLEQVRRETIHVPYKNWDRQADPVSSSLDFKIALRQILLTMIEASIHLIAPEDNAADLFVLMFENLEKRHKPRVDKSSLKQLTEMGFSEARAIKALQLKRNVVEAMEWLLDETNKQQHNNSEAENDILLLPPERRKSFFMSGRDPAHKVIQEFNNYVEKWFVPNETALQNLASVGYGEDLAREALRISCNNEKLAKEFLEGNSNLGDNFQRGFERDSPIMSAILDSPVVQVALSKPKTLFALMVLCETPHNVNVWLSDTETHPVVSQILRIYHSEKYRLRTDNHPKVATPAEEEEEEEVPIEDEVNSSPVGLDNASSEGATRGDEDARPEAAHTASQASSSTSTGDKSAASRLIPLAAGEERIMESAESPVSSTSGNNPEEAKGGPDYSNSERMEVDEVDGFLEFK